MEDIITLFGLPLAYIALVLAAIGSIGFPLYFMLKDLKKAKTALIGVGALLAIFLICFLFAGGEAATVGNIEISGGQMKWINAGIFAVYITGAGAILAIIYTSVARYFK
ncbi:MAG: hypothetical protein LBU62_11955 [Bacteroidales bacterium]|jgi:hypothetical protein|nr:hypothetical protein [Bacteroidales bacterium]